MNTVKMNTVKGKATSRPRALILILAPSEIGENAPEARQPRNFYVAYISRERVLPSVLLDPILNPSNWEGAERGGTGKLICLERFISSWRWSKGSSYGQIAKRRDFLELANRWCP
jgi:hypothetical protein